MLGRSAKLGRVVRGLVVFALLVIGIALPSLTSLSFSILMATILSLVVALFPDRMQALILGREEPTVLLEPLQMLSFSPESNLTRSQWVNMAWMNASSGQQSLTALFGVIRVRAIEADAIECRAAARINFQDVWLDGGYFNWYSPTRIRNLTTIPNFQALNLNTYLSNTTEHITKDETKDLLVLYMFQNSIAVMLCTDMAHSFAGNFEPGQPLKFKIEVSLTAQHQRKTITVFNIEASWGRVIITKSS